MKLEARCGTTAMGIMPHTDVDKAIELALSLDIPYWPQLPRVSFFEDMYVQVSQNFPGIAVDTVSQKLSFDTDKFEEELGSYSQKMGEPDIFTLNRDYSAVYHRFLEKDLKGCRAIRGQVIGPVSFGFKVMDENNMPLIYNEGIKALLFDFIQRKTNIQYYELSRNNRNAFVWLDEPGLGWVFSGLSGYSDVQAKGDFRDFLKGLEGPRALHLCANVNLPYLLGLGIELLSFDAYQMEFMPAGYASAVAEFLGAGGIICWGIVPTDSTSLGQETPEKLSRRLTGYWEVVSQNTILTPEQVARQALIAPARCCLRNTGQVGAVDEKVSRTADKDRISSTEERIVEKAFTYLKEISQILKDKYSL